MATNRILWIFPCVTQLMFSACLPFFSEFSLSGLGYILLFATLPALYFALICRRYRFHQRNLLQLAFWSGTLSFLNTLILFSLFLLIEPMQTPISFWEQLFAIIFYGLMFALPSMLYAIGILRLFLPKRA